jgi:hypothetical protein
MRRKKTSCLKMKRCFKNEEEPSLENEKSLHSEEEEEKEEEGGAEAVVSE